MQETITKKELSEKLKTGISIIDYQHQQLLNLFEKLENMPKKQNETYELLIEVSNHIFTHFKTEENLMNHINYPNFKSHKRKHDELTSQYRRIVKKCLINFNFDELNLDINEFIYVWFDSHYSIEEKDDENDLKLVNYILELKDK